MYKEAGKSVTTRDGDEEEGGGGGGRVAPTESSVTAREGIGGREGERGGRGSHLDYGVPLNMIMAKITRINFQA